MSFKMPYLMGLFQKRFDGDDNLLELARLRFQESGMDVEFYADNQEELNHLLKYKPKPENTVVVHLPRWINLFQEESVAAVMNFAQSFQNKIYGYVIHDQNEITDSFDDYVKIIQNMNSRLHQIQNAPYLFIEYAVGLEPSLYIHLLMHLQNLEHVSACIDVGHIGLWQVRKAYRQRVPHEDACSLSPYDTKLPEVIEVLDDAVRSAQPLVLNVIREAGRFKKPIHFHLHDGHPLSTFSPYGISDHLTFLEEISIPFEYKGKRTIQPMFGPSGLHEMINESFQSLPLEFLSFSLEIHPKEGRFPLGNAMYLFEHWEDRANAERMNFWLTVLAQNYRLLQKACHLGIEKLAAKAV